MARFIPVNTGNTQTSGDVFVLMPVYPCAYREHPIGKIFPVRYCGLSLCIQGTRLDRQRVLIESPVYPCAYREHQ